MNIRLLFGEIRGEDIIDIGEVVTVTYGDDLRITGRLNNASKEEITVGTFKINVDSILKIEVFK